MNFACLHTSSTRPSTPLLTLLQQRAVQLFSLASAKTSREQAPSTCTYNVFFVYQVWKPLAPLSWCWRHGGIMLSVIMTLHLLMTVQ
jgi:hypothetical protein